MIKTYLKTSADTEGRRMDVYNGIRTELGMHYINSTVVLVAGWIAVNQEPLSPPFMCRCVLDHSMGVCPSQQTAKHGTGPGMARFSVAGFSDELLWHVVTLFGGNPNCVFFLLGGLGLWAPDVCDRVHVFMSYACFSAVLKWQWWQHSMCLWRKGWCTLFWVFCISFPNSFLWFWGRCAFSFGLRVSTCQTCMLMPLPSPMLKHLLYCNPHLCRCPRSSLQSLHVCHNTCPTDVLYHCLTIAISSVSLHVLAACCCALQPHPALNEHSEDWMPCLSTIQVPSCTYQWFLFGRNDTSKQFKAYTGMCCTMFWIVWSVVLVKPAHWNFPFPVQVFRESLQRHVWGAGQSRQGSAHIRSPCDNLSYSLSLVVMACNIHLNHAAVCHSNLFTMEALWPYQEKKKKDSQPGGLIFFYGRTL